MRFPLSWLREWVAVPDDEAGLLHRLTMGGLEVEAHQVQGAGLEQLVVARIESCEPHPDADRLRVCSVDDGSGQRLQIVCGAPNARAGLRAPLARVGSQLPNGQVIDQARLRGVASFGMLCSGRELGLSDDHDGLLALPEDAPPGQSLDQYLGYPDHIVELSITPNRGDCLSIAGLARETGALYGVPVRQPVIAVQAVTLERRLPIRLSAAEACPRYCGRLIEGLRPGLASPEWIQRRLRQCGLRPINALVDVTNYVMLEWGQPLHAFDADRIAGAIDVRWASPGERLRLLDERDVALDSDMLVIADDSGPLALAGVMGGGSSKVVDETRTVFLESAHFSPTAISGRARRLGLHTDASHRFERGVDPELPRLALERATELLLQICGGKAGAVVEAVETAALPRSEAIVLRQQRLERVLGMQLPAIEVLAALKGLGMQVSEIDGGWRALPPSCRFDLAIEEDLIEEVVRLHGYDRVPTHAPRGEIALISPSELWVADDQLAHALVARGYREAVCLAFGAVEAYRAWSFGPEFAALSNPLSADLAVMRPSLLPGLTHALIENQRRQIERVRLFELGRVFAGCDGVEQQHLGVVACGPALPEQWGLPARVVDFHDLKADAEALLSRLGQHNAVQWRRSDRPFLHPGRSADLYLGDRRVGWLGHLHPALLRQLDSPQEIIALELELTALRPRAPVQLAAVSRQPSVRRDLALIIDEAVDYAHIQSSIAELGLSALRDLRLFDVYRGQGVPAGSKSLAIGLIFQEESRTLAEGEVDAWVEAVRHRLTAVAGASWRG